MDTAKRIFTGRDKLKVALVLLILAAIGSVGVKTLITPPPAHSAGVSPAWANGVVYAWSAVCGCLMLLPLLRRQAQRHWHVFREIRPGVVAQCVALIGVTIGIACGLRALFPFLNRSWLYLLPGNDGSATNIGVLPATLPFFGLIFVVLFALNIPLLAYREEKQYREGTRDWKHAFWRSLRFGLAHCLVGIPLYAGLALSVTGLWYSYQYFKGGVARSTLHHATYNLILAALLAVVGILILLPSGPLSR